jgi:hypothetical protein
MVAGKGIDGVTAKMATTELQTLDDAATRE